MKQEIKKRLGELLLEDGILSLESLEEALCHQKQSGGMIGQILIQLGYLSEEELISALGRQLFVPYVSLAQYAVNMETVGLMGDEFARKHMMAIFDCDDKNVYIATSDPLNTTPIEEIRQRLKLKPQVFISTPTEIHNLFDLAFSKEAHRLKAG